jgi:hypothetical protein
MKLGWWNTNLAPPSSGTERPSDSRVRQALFEVRELVRRHVVAIGLAEVDQPSIERLARSVGAGWRYLLTSARRNLGLLYNSSLIEVSRLEDLRTGSEAGPHVAALVTLDRKVSSVRAPFVLALVHWRTDLHEGREAREDCARILNEKLKGSPSVVMGDFNCEPYSREVVRYLRASREHVLVRSGKADFFNPFWRFPNKEGTPWACLRLQRPSDEFLTRWRLVDFGIVSGSLVDGLDALVGEVIELDTARMTSDHLPVILDVPIQAGRFK